MSRDDFWIRYYQIRIPRQIFRLILVKLFPSSVSKLEIYNLWHYELNNKGALMGSRNHFWLRNYQRQTSSLSSVTLVELGIGNMKHEIRIPNFVLVLLELVGHPAVITIRSSC